MTSAFLFRIRTSLQEVILILDTALQLKEREQRDRQRKGGEGQKQAAEEAGEGVATKRASS